MTEYDNGPRGLAWPLLHPLVASVTVEDDAECAPSSFVWPDDPDERTLVPFYLSLNEYNILGSTIDVGSDIAFGDDALRVMWLWMRNFRCNVPICDLIDACITGNPATIAAIAAQLIVNTTYNEYLNQTVVEISPPAGGNLYPPRPTSATPDPLCNAATYVVSKIRALFVEVYDDLETLTAQEVLEAILGVFGWRSGPLYQLIGLLETTDQATLLDAFDDATPDIICQLIEDELDQTAVLAWVATTYPTPSVLGDALAGAIESAADDGKYAQWIAVGATMTGATCDCGPSDWIDNDFSGGDDHGWSPYVSGISFAAWNGGGFERDDDATQIGIVKSIAGVVTDIELWFDAPLSGSGGVMWVGSTGLTGLNIGSSSDEQKWTWSGLAISGGLGFDLYRPGGFASNQYVTRLRYKLA